MKSYKKVMIASLLIFTILACSLFTPSGDTSSSGGTSSSPECNLPNLSPEECVNAGTHSYYFTTEDRCSTISGENEKFIVTFFDTYVILEKIEPTDETWTNRYEKTSLNTYAKDTGDSSQITIEFINNGFTMISPFIQSDGCVKYIRTITP